MPVGPVVGEIVILHHCDLRSHLRNQRHHAGAVCVGEGLKACEDSFRLSLPGLAWLASARLQRELGKGPLPDAHRLTKQSAPDW